MVVLVGALQLLAAHSGVAAEGDFPPANPTPGRAQLAITAQHGSRASGGEK